MVLKYNYCSGNVHTRTSMVMALKSILSNWPKSIFVCVYRKTGRTVDFYRLGDKYTHLPGSKINSRNAFIRSFKLASNNTFLFTLQGPQQLNTGNCSNAINNIFTIYTYLGWSFHNCCQHSFSVNILWKNYKSKTAITTNIVLTCTFYINIIL